LNLKNSLACLREASQHQQKTIMIGISKMKNNQILSTKLLLVPATVALGMLLSQSVLAQLDNSSGTPVANLLVGDLPVGLSSPEAAFGLAIENLCPQLAARQSQNTAIQTDLFKRCGDLIFDTTPQTESLRQVAPEEIATQESDIVELSSNQLNSIGSRLAGLRSSMQTSSQQVSLDGSRPGLLALNLKGYGSGAGDDIANSGRLGVYVNATIGTGDKDQTAKESGFDIDSTSVTFGVDYRLNGGAFIGAALGINSSDSDMSNNGGSVESDGVSLMVYGTKSLSDSLYIEGTLGSGQYDYDTSRNLNYTARDTSVNQTALASTDADMNFASIGVGFNPSYAQDEGIEISYSGRLNYLDADVEGFTERMSNQNANGFGMNLQIDGQQIESMTSVLGVQASKVFGTSSGVIIPFIELSYIHEFKDDPRTIRARFANDPFSAGFNQTNGTFPSGANASSNGQSAATIISIVTDAPDTDYFRFALGTSGVLPKGRTWFVSADTTLGLQGTSYYSMTGGFRGEF
jgi:outer membrane lipase/esterase